MEYFVTTDEHGEQVQVGEFTLGGDVTHDVGETVTLKGSDGVERSWTIVRKVTTAYSGVTFFVEPAE